MRGPSTATKANGGLSSSTHSAARPSRCSDLPFTVVVFVVKMKSSPSRTNQIGTTCGAPSLRATASLPVWVPAWTNVRHSSWVIGRDMGASRQGRLPGRRVRSWGFLAVPRRRTNRWRLRPPKTYAPRSRRGSRRTGTRTSRWPSGGTSSPAPGYAAPTFPEDAWGKGWGRDLAMVVTSAIAEHGAIGPPAGLGDPARGADDRGARQRAPEAGGPAAHPERPGRVVPAVLRAGRGLRPRRPADEGDQGR